MHLVLLAAFGALGSTQAMAQQKPAPIRAASTPAAPVAASTLNLRLRDIAPHGLVVAPLNLRHLADSTRRTDWSKFAPVVALRTGARTRVPAQWIPDTGFDGKQNFSGTLVLQLPPNLASAGRADLELRAAFDAEPQKIVEAEQIVATKYSSLHFDPRKSGGFPGKITFAKSNRVFENFTWNDRLFNTGEGAFALNNDRQASLQILSDGAVCTVLRSRARFVSSAGKAPASQPAAIYDWYVFKQYPLVFVAAQARQSKPYAWKEHHFLELNFSDESFKKFAGGQPRKDGEFSDSGKATNFDNWAAIVEGRDAIGMLGSRTIVYDGRSGYGSYLHFAQPQPWQGWNETTRRMSAWLWIGSDDEPIKTVSDAAERFISYPQLTAVRPAVEEYFTRQRAAAARLPEATRRQALWRLSLLERREASGELDLKSLQNIGVAKLAESPQISASNNDVAPWSLLSAGELGLALQIASNRPEDEPRPDDFAAGNKGLRLHSIFDLRAGQELCAAPSRPLFTLRLRNNATREERQLVATAGWKEIKLTRERDGLGVLWSRPLENGATLSVNARAVANAANSAWSWTLDVQNNSKQWSLQSVIFPDVGVADIGTNGRVFFPNGPGEVQNDLWRHSFILAPRMYPNGYTAMQFMAAYRESTPGGSTPGAPPTGLYLATHDPTASNKTLKVESSALQKEVRFSYEHPVANTEAQRWSLPGHVVWQRLNGDWFDAARIYKNWVQREASWWPQLGKDGREDTPLWMRELSAWSLVSGDATKVPDAAKRMSQFLEIPTGLHWYNWHHAPFDNDYPHYFPPKENFREGVADAQRNNVFVMPYINGRLWDTRDRGLEDWQFSSLALPWTTKEEKEGKLVPRVESYSSKESDGSPVKLAAMCPYTEFWQNKVREVVLRLTKEEGVKGVYIDQIAASAPVTCLDPTHGHPIGGGNWWARGYAKMLSQIQTELPPDAILTSENHAEVYLKYLDGYLTWHWQSSDQVPAFPAVYGGAIQLFGRAYRGGPDKSLALRMKSAQQLVYGEQMGWMNTDYLLKEIDEPSRDFFKRAVATRYRLRRYFYAGEMARPPKLQGNIPTLTADWQWSGVWPVTNPAVQTGAWQEKAARKLVLIFTNSSDEKIGTKFHFDAAQYELPAKSTYNVTLQKDDASAPQSLQWAPKANQNLTLEPRSTITFEIAW
jgi:hypothetical protein